MKSISNKIKNILVIKGNGKKLDSFEEQLKRISKNLVLVPCTKKITSDFINKNWKKEISRLNKGILYSRLSAEERILFFGNSKFENEVLEMIAKLELNAQYSSYISSGRKFVFLNSFYKNGLFIGESESPITRGKYSIAIV